MRNWIFLTNPILTASDSSMLIALKLSTYHDAALLAAKADAFYLALYNSYHPFHVALKTAYDASVTQDGLQVGESLNLNQLLKLLTHTKIQQWDIKIQNVYLQSTPQYKKLLPNRRSPFQSGAQLDRIHSVQSLSKAIGTDIALTTVKADIDSFYAQLDAAYNTQKVSLSTTKMQSKAFETARIAMCNAQFANYGALIQKFAATPETIAQFFDLKILRNSQQVIFTGHVKPNEVFTVVKHTFTETDEVFIDNTGTTALQFYLAEGKDQRPTATALLIAPGKHTVSVKDLGANGNTFVSVFNPEPNLAGEFEIEIV